MIPPSTTTNTLMDVIIDPFLKKYKFFEGFFERVWWTFFVSYLFHFEDRAITLFQQRGMVG